jgi:hypothetical protein
MFKGEPADEVQKLLDEIKGEAVRGAQDGKLNFLMPAFASLLVNLSNAADRRAKVIEKWTKAIFWLTGVLIALTLVLVVLTALLVYFDGVQTEDAPPADRASSSQVLFTDALRTDLDRLNGF